MTHPDPSGVANLQRQRLATEQARFSYRHSTGRPKESCHPVSQDVQGPVCPEVCSFHCHGPQAGYRDTPMLLPTTCRWLCLSMPGCHPCSADKEAGTQASPQAPSTALPSHQRDTLMPRHLLFLTHSCSLSRHGEVWKRPEDREPD